MASRRAFLNVLKKPLSKTKESSPLVVRPPYGLNESLFGNVCVTCESKRCVDSCNEQIILIQADGTPRVDFSKSGCTFCEDCASACIPNVLRLDNVHAAERLNATFRISSEGCVAHHGVVCFSCKEPCIDDAILFNGMFSPVIDRDKCTGCGFCLGRCPTEAISYDAVPIMEQVP